MKTSRCRDIVSVGILFLINLINYMDRLTVAGVLIDIQDYYSISNASAGLLQTCFIVSYLMFAPIFGYLGDRHSRKLIVIFGITFWSVATLLGSFVNANHVCLFFILRAIVGIGEASYSTIAPTIIADLFERKLRTKMIALFYFAIPIGSGLGYLVGSAVNKMFGGWQWAFRVTPPLGILSVVLLAVFVEEPERGKSDGFLPKHHKSNLKSDISYLIRVKSFVWSTIGFTCTVLTLGALSWWAPAYIEFSYQVSGDISGIDFIGIIFGGITVLAGFIGVGIGSGTAHYFKERNYKKSDPIVCAIGIFIAIPFAFSALALPELFRNLSWISMFFTEVFLSMNWAIVTDILLYVIIPNRRSIAQAMQISCSHLLGDAISPFIVGQISDWIAQGDQSIQTKYSSLQVSLYISLLVLIPGGIAFVYCAFFIEKDEQDIIDLMEKYSDDEKLDHNYLNNCNSNSNSNSSPSNHKSSEDYSSSSIITPL